MAGGADAMIFGSGFSDKPSDNIVSLTTDKLSSSEQTFMCPKLTSKFKMIQIGALFIHNPTFLEMCSFGRVPLQDRPRTSLLQTAERRGYDRAQGQDARLQGIRRIQCCLKSAHGRG